MTTCRNHQRTEELSAPAVGEDESLQGLILGELMGPPPPFSVDPQQSVKVFAQEHLITHWCGKCFQAIDTQSMPIVRSKALGTATKGQDSPWGIISGSDSGHNLSEQADSSFAIRASELSTLRKEYVDLMNLKDNGEIVLEEAMEATERLNTVFNQIRTSMKKMSPTMKELFLGPKRKSSGKTIESGNNWSRDKAATKAATE
ncbi:hypothetical protein M422DRAFT_262318 [Sphaerobolus stellatus SS14]|uniref:Uncharacterized protein n=1 Tax=Sphaerobolus stellatus (strain SS14) TaxID=990650 RepID=A0A0C9V167_SPHS4|nr:hypothetical protein M422DRAFT_262318 [Sphaerobolus stellatus SS14]